MPSAKKAGQDASYSRDTKSLCPVCLSVVKARVFEKGG